MFIEANPQTVIEPRIADPVLDVLEFALARVRSGWCQGAMVDHDGNFCTIGAIIVYDPADNNWDDHDPWADATADELTAMFQVARAVGIESDELIDWNDAPHREQYQVVRAFEAAIESRKGGGE